MAFRLRPDKSVAKRLKLIVREQIGKAGAEIAKASRSHHDAVHQVRRRCKRIRALLRLVRPAMGRQYEFENRFFRDTARSLAAMRDAEVLGKTFATLVVRDKRRRFTALRRQLKEERRPVAADQSAEKDKLTKVADRLQEALPRIRSWKLSATGFAAIAEGLRSTYARGRQAGRRAYSQPDARRFHEFRMRVKDHRHHLQLLCDIWPAGLAAHCEALEELGELLGDDHDLAMLRRWLAAQKGQGRERDLVLALLERRSAALRATARPLAERVFAEKPKPFCQRIRKYWGITRREKAKPPT